MRYVLASRFVNLTEHAVNPPHLVALVRAGAMFVNGKNPRFLHCVA